MVTRPRGRSGHSERSAAARWLAGVQNPDGGFPSSPGGESSVAITGWAMLGLEAAGRNPLDLRRGGRSPVTYLRRNADAIGSTGDLARTILALDAAGIDPHRFAGRNLVAELRRRRQGNGSFDGWPNSTAFAVMALRSAGARHHLSRSLRWLHRAQNDDGGWGVVPGSPSDPDSTGAVLQAVAAHRSVARALRYLRRAQVAGGGFRLGGSSVINTQSTAWAAQGMLAAGESPRRIREGGRDAIDYISARQSADGHIRYSKTSDQTPVWVTAQAMVPLYGRSFPLPPVPRARRRAPNPRATAGRAANADSAPASPPRSSSASGARGRSASASAKGGAGAPPTALSASAPGGRTETAAHPRASRAEGRGPAPPQRRPET